MRLLQLSILTLILLASAGTSAQLFPELQPEPEKSITYLAFGVSLPLRHHFDGDAQVDNLRFLPDGIHTKFGAGIHLNRWLGSGLYTGTEYRLSEKMLTIPLYSAIRIAPEINEDTRIVVQPAFGYAMAIGHGNMSGYCGKISLGLEALDGISYFAEFTQYGFSRDDTGKIRSISFGLGLVIF